MNNIHRICFKLGRCIHHGNIWSGYLLIMLHGKPSIFLTLIVQCENCMLFHILSVVVDHICLYHECIVSKIGVMNQNRDYEFWSDWVEFNKMISNYNFLKNVHVSYICLMVQIALHGCVQVVLISIFSDFYCFISSSTHEVKSVWAQQSWFPHCDYDEI